MENQLIITYILLGIISLVMIGFLTYRIVTIVKYSKGEKIFRKNMKVGDRCYTHTSGHFYQHGEIKKIYEEDGEEFVDVEIKVRKDWVSQPVLDKNGEEKRT